MVNEQWIGYTLGKYRINKLLWKKRSSTFYAASDVNTNENVLIKMIYPDIFADYGQQLLEMLYQNVRVSLSIHHPCLPAVYDTGRAGEYFYIVMEYLPGATMEQMLVQTGIVNPVQAIYVAKEICKALWAGHEKGMLHLDIKPRNILLMADTDEVKLLEFGLAMPIENTGMIGAGKVLLGSSFYIAPEQIRGERELDPRSDLYSLGANLFHWVVGQPPYQGTNSEILQQHLQASIPSIRIYNASLPESLDAVINILMQKNPDQRMSSAKELENILNSLLMQLPKAKAIEGNDVPKDVEEFLITKISRSDEDKIFIQNTLLAIADSQKKGNIPDEVQILMDKIIIQEFEDRFGSPETKEMMERVKQCPVLLKNPKAWIEAKIAEAKSNRQTQSRKLPNISQEFTKTSRMKVLAQGQSQTPTSVSRSTEKIPSLDNNFLDSPKTPVPGLMNANLYRPASPSSDKGHRSFSGRSNEIPGLDSALEARISEGRTQEMPSQSKSQKIPSLQGKIPEMQPGYQEKPKTWTGKTQEISSMPAKTVQRPITAHGKPITGHGRMAEPITSHGRMAEPITSHGKLNDSGYDMQQQEKPKTFHGKSQMFPVQADVNKAFSAEEALASGMENIQQERSEYLKTSSMNRMGREQEAVAPAPSKIIKSSQKAMEAVIAIPASSGQTRTAGKNKNASPLDYIQQAMSEEQKKKTMRTSKKNGEKSPNLMRKFLIILLLLGCVGFALFHLYNVPQIKESVDIFVRNVLVELKILNHPVEKKPEKIYQNIEPQIIQFCQKKQYSRAWYLLKNTEVSDETKTKLTTIILKEEAKFSITLTPGIGWFGEKLLEGMKRLPTPGEYIWEKDKSTMVFVPEGNFYRGADNPSENAFPAKQIYLSDYYIDKYEVTNKQYSQFVLAVGHKEAVFAKTLSFQGEDFPVVGISWNDANQYAQWAGKRLPTEAEWEKACRGGESIPDWQTQGEKIAISQNSLPQRTYPWGDAPPSVLFANYKQLSPPYDPYSKTAPVGSFREGTSPYLCEDMMGNVMEWCYDQYDKAYYHNQETRNPRGPKHRLNESHVCRGGDWETDAFSLFSYKRYPYHPDASYNTLGFRLVKDRER